MNESEQAQAQMIAEIDAMMSNWSEYSIGSFVNACENLRDLVDSQAQKIAKYEDMLEGGIVSMNKADALLKDCEQKIAEQANTIGRYENSIANLSEAVLKQAKEIERLKDRLRFEMLPDAKEGL